ncbi:diadenosine 5',5'''-P1,P4-tetraphosphate hydrolase [Hordeum vulgare]|nr:diadenosine 5',5'''-P1,P4-tetraphosphate hydrolase [Hordeum vulgare]
MTVAAARCLILTPTISSSSSAAAAVLRLPRVARRRPLSCSASPLAVFASMDSPPEGYRTNVGICLADPSLTKAPHPSPPPSPSPLTLSMPHSLADRFSPPADLLRVQDRHPHRVADASGEEPRAAAIRELREETGVRSAEIVAEAPNWLTYDFPADVKDKLNARWGTNWKGQAQKWFLFRLTGGDDEINLMGDGSEKPEFSEWAWMTPKQVIEKVVHLFQLDNNTPTPLFLETGAPTNIVSMSNSQAVDFKKPVYEETLKHFAPYLQSDPAASS